jgi:peptide/nickel transport system substrate-binding protein
MSNMRSTCFLVLVSLLLFNNANRLVAQEIKYIETGMPNLLNPIDGSREIIGVRILQLLYRGMIARDRMGDWQPVLALDDPVFDEESMTLTFHLKEGLLWSDGQPITAQDVVHSYEIYMDPRSNYGNVDIFENFDGVVAEDDYTVSFHLKKADIRSKVRAGFFIMPHHLVGDSTYISPENDYNRILTGAGPYVIDKMDGNHIEFKVNPSYYKAPPAIRAMQMIVNPDENIHNSLLQAGFIDLDPVIRPRDIPVYDADFNVDLYPYDSKAWYGFAYNCKKGILRFREVRQAFSMAFNRVESLNSTFQGKGGLISGPFTPSSQYFNPNIRPYPYEPGYIGTLLDSLEIVDTDGDGFREFNGETLVLRMVLSRSMSQDNKDVCADFAQQLKSHRIKVEVDFQEQKAWYEKIFYERDYDITFVQWEFDDGGNIYPLFSRTQQGPGMYNIIQFEHDEIEGLLDRFRNTTDDSERTEVGKRLHELLNFECPYTFLWTLTSNSAYRNDTIRRINPDSFYFFSFIDEWLLEE